MQRRTIWFSGNVQGVGFRYTAYSLARGYEITGYVRNLGDGRVELVMEGTPEEMESFLEELRQRMAGCIHGQKSDEAPANGEFTRFSIRH